MHLPHTLGSTDPSLMLLSDSIPMMMTALLVTMQRSMDLSNYFNFLNLIVRCLTSKLWIMRDKSTICMFSSNRGCLNECSSITKRVYMRFRTGEYNSQSIKVPNLTIANC